MKKVLAVILAVTLLATAAVFAACTNADYTIGISQYVDIDALNQATKGFKDRLNEWAEAKGKTIDFVEQNANDDRSNAATIATNLVAQRCDIIFANATHSATAAASKTTTIPILFTSVTNPEADIFGGATQSEIANVTGTSDMNPVEQQIALLKTVVETKGATLTKFAVLYSSNETNSKKQYDMVVAYCAENLPTVTVKQITIAQSSELPTALSTANLEGVQAVYIPTDNTIADNMATVASKTQPLSIPLITGESGTCAEDNTGLCTISISYYLLGKQTAEMAIKILEGAKPSSIPFEFYTGENAFTINETTALALGFSQAQINTLKSAFTK